MINIIIGVSAGILVALFTAAKIVRYLRNKEAVKRGEIPLPSCCSGCSSCSSPRCQCKY